MTKIPQSLLNTWPSIRADEWEQLSEHRWRAPHNTDGFAWCVVVCFGETIGRPVKREDEAEGFAELFESAAQLSAHRVACQNGTPVVRPNDDACLWCGNRRNGHDPDRERAAGQAPKAGQP